MMINPENRSFCYNFTLSHINQPFFDESKRGRFKQKSIFESSKSGTPNSNQTTILIFSRNRLILLSIFLSLCLSCLSVTILFFSLSAMKFFYVGLFNIKCFILLSFLIHLFFLFLFLILFLYNFSFSFFIEWFEGHAKVFI